MLDNALITLIIQILISGEATAGIENTPIAQAFQPTQQGVNTQPTAFIYKIDDYRYGSLLREDIWDPVHSRFNHIESQQYETTFQLSTLATQDPANQSQYTASDICNLCASILQSDVAIKTFQASGVGIERITRVRNPNLIDDRDRNEFNPNFDFVCTHKQTISSTTPVLQPTEIAIYEV